MRDHPPNPRTPDAAAPPELTSPQRLLLCIFAYTSVERADAQTLWNKLAEADMELRKCDFDEMVMELLNRDLLQIKPDGKVVITNTGSASLLCVTSATPPRSP